MKGGGFHKPKPIAGTTAAAEAFIAGADAGEGAAAAAKPPPRAAAAKESAPKPPAKVAPWAEADPKHPHHVNIKFDGVTHAKLKWITNNVPQLKSIQKIVDAFLIAGVDKLIKEHYKP